MIELMPRELKRNLNASFKERGSCTCLARLVYILGVLLNKLYSYTYLINAQGVVCIPIEEKMAHGNLSILFNINSTSLLCSMNDIHQISCMIFFNSFLSIVLLFEAVNV